MILLLLLCVVISNAEWQLIYDKFNEPSISSSSSGWDFGSSCTGGGGGGCSGSRISCTENQNEMLRINEDCKRMDKDFTNLTPHFELKFIYDIYVLGSKSDTSYRLYFYADSSLIYSFTYNSGIAIYEGDKMCRDNDDTDQNFFTKTRIEIFNHGSSSVNLKFCTNISDNDLHIGIRNMQLYQNSCYAKCKQCSSELYCTSCYSGSPAGGNCQPCPANTLFIDITKSSCQQECDSDKVPDSENICQTDPNISQYNQYFDSSSITSYGDWEFIADPVYYSLFSQDRVTTCSSKDYIGPFGTNEAMQLKLSLANTVQYIRFRVTFFLQNWADDTSLQILWNDIPIDLIYQSSSVIYSQTSTIILSDTFGCDKRVRIEKLFTNTQIDSKLTFKGNMQIELNQLWGFRDVQIDYGVCEKNCDLCASSTKCQTCSGSRKKHKGKCLSSCPLYSTESGSVCNDFDDDLDYSKYYIKAFYDTSTTDEEASTVMGTFQTIGSNNLKSGGAVFSYLPYKRVFGGSLVWYDARVYRNITNIKPHYQYKLKMEVVLGEREGNFYYNFTGSSNNQIVESGGNLPTPTNQSNLWAQSDNEYQYSITEVHSHFSDFFNFEMRYDCERGNPQDGFAAISNFYLIFYYCVPLCPYCSGPTNSDCTWGTNSDTTMQQLIPGGPITCKDHYYLLADELTVTYTCIPCETNCDVCTSGTYCTTCFTDFYLMNGKCECMEGTYLSTPTTCSVCDDLCLTCNGPNNNDCLACYEGQFRMLNKNECVCKPYYNLQIDGTCSPVCGDMMVMPGEDCDDGNTIQYDGCHQCQFQCEQNCQICLFGKCAICSDGYYLNSQTNLCQSKCGDSILSGIEECEDGNLVPYDGCYQCKFQCQNECTDCQNGICFACQTGWRMNSLKYFCEPYCGDGIIDGSEQCDDGNQQPFDGCFNCKYSCHNKCTQCARGQCLLCASGYQLDQVSQFCISICGDKFRTETEECDDGNIVPYDGCYECEFQCEQECTNCFYGQCIECDIGFVLNRFTGKCEVAFGDGIIIQKFEFCDDHNQLPNDGCYWGQQSCQIGCEACYLENCLKCDTLWYLDQGLCYPICGDGIIVVGFEECDDGNYVQFDGCFNCKYQSQLECIQSQYGVCQECIQGWSLSYQNICQEEYFNNSYILKIQEGCVQQFQDNCQLCYEGWNLNNFEGKCEPYCGDYSLQEYEECDNDDIYQCYECKFICHPECKDCRYGVCYECQSGFILINNICQSLCGDLIVNQLEECDDGNLFPFDECYQCQLKCDEQCLVCAQGICLQCDNSKGYYLDNGGKCQSKCGDNLIAGKEQCDIKEPYCDHNCQFFIVSNCLIHEIDGCTQCQIGYQLLNGFCEPICGDLIKVEGEYCDDLSTECVNCQLKCQTECVDCINQDICIKCDEKNGFYLDYSGLCVSRCSDLIVSQNETCDDLGDNCNQCQWQCDAQCSICSQGNCLSCNSGYYLDYDLQQCIPICGDGIIMGIEQCEDNNDVPFDGCYNCQYSCQKECDSCILGVCYSCNEFGWEYNQVNGSCDPICGDYYRVGTEECDDGNVIPYDGCFECKLQCQQPCTSCLIGKCWECDTLGWELNSSNMCISICGDGITVGDEHCDDGNNIRYDGCYDCNFECQEQCTDCRFESCFGCTVGWKLNNYICESICGDQLVVFGEDCDDGNEIANDGCFECKYQCDIMCLECGLGLCVTCQTGWQVNSLGKCDPICGDGVVQIGYEECDDGNDTEFDGCYKCFYSCHEACTNCFEGKCLECNTIGWIPWNDVCQPECGDGIIIQPEQCDDMNLIPHDGCNNCQYECHEKCVDCEDGICIKCDEGWYEYANQCVSHCGDGIYVSENEDCDDGNIQDQDGCDSECEVEIDWICENQKSLPSACHFSLSPKIVANILEIVDATTIVQITIDQQVKQSRLAQQLHINQPKQYLEFSIKSQLQQNYEIKIEQIQGVSKVSADVKYNVTIKFLVAMQRPELEIKVSKEYIVNDYDQPILENEVILQLESPELISNSEIQSAESASQFTETVVYTLIGVAGISVLTGSLGMLQNLLDQLQFLSYIKYVNIKFPRNLNIYFETFKLVSMGPVLRVLKIDQLLKLINEGSTPHIQPAPKFSQDNINAYFLNNFQTFLFCLFTGYGGYLMSKLISKGLYKLGAFHMSKLGDRGGEAILSVRKSLDKLQKGFFYSGLLRILMANYYDISFATLLQLSNWNLDSMNYAINSVLALCVFLSQFYVMYKILAQTTKIIKSTSFVNKKQFQALFDGVNQNKPTFWSLQFNSIQMIKKLLFMAIITLFQDEGAIQSILVGCTSTAFLAYLILSTPFDNKYEYYKQLVSESVVVFNTLTFLFYQFHQEADLQYESLLLLGWIHIATFSSSLCSSLGFDLWQQCQTLYSKMKSLLSKKKPEQSTILFY